MIGLSPRIFRTVRHLGRPAMYHPITKDMGVSPLPNPEQQDSEANGGEPDEHAQPNINPLHGSILAQSVQEQNKPDDAEQKDYD